MKRTEILKFNSKQFLNDVASVNTVCVLALNTNSSFTILKRELLETASYCQIQYSLTDKLYKNGRTVMLIH